ncbi:cupin [Oerskovia turbata]|uniref:Cupin n=1 Tax=Oerskovia turbata TaxID=1713 RepID=A0A4Q1L041_9CELL|nr:cupin [Oerskovia turbata]RXR25073.1 cupin [Oerskovia turbata]RXR35219.1 cupin [Oerskovia turbata]TGJ96456.1 cupin [Actinotalea fermentans ATCC 43279 = JCM 9966 = DSM 3133]
MTNLELLTDAHMTRARDGDNGRSAEVVLHDGVLRQTIIALVAGIELGEHNSPPAASIQVLRGRVRVTAPAGDEEVGPGELRVLTHERHAVAALEDSAFLLTTVTSVPTQRL